MINGYFNIDGRPTIRGMVVIPELDVWDGVDFLVDTGADMTCLHWPDVGQLGLDLQQLRQDPGGPTSIRGVGGSQGYHVVRGQVAFLDEPALDSLVVFTIDIHVAESAQASGPTPSLLGRDILDQIVMIYDAPRQRLELHHDEVL